MTTLYFYALNMYAFPFAENLLLGLLWGFKKLKAVPQYG